MSAAAEFPAVPRADAAALVRWPACLALVLALHAAVVVALLRRADTLEPFVPPPEAIMIDLAPVPGAPPAVEETPPAEPEPEPADEPPPPPESVAEAPPEPPPEPAEQVAEIPPEPPPEPAPTAVPEAVLPQPPPPPPPPPRPAIRPQTQPRPAAEDRRAVAETRQAAEAPPSPAVAQPPPQLLSNAVPAWQGQLLGRLQRFKRYPESARSRREEGVVHLTFSMDREGRVLAANVAKGSGFPELDAETLALVRRAEPLPSPPPEMQGNPLTLTVPVRFSLR